MSEKIKVKPYKKQKKEPQKQTPEAYEKNLKLNLEAKRTDHRVVSNEDRKQKSDKNNSKK